MSPATLRGLGQSYIIYSATVPRGRLVNYPSLLAAFGGSLRQGLPVSTTRCAGTEWDLVGSAVSAGVTLRQPVPTSLSPRERLFRRKRRQSGSTKYSTNLEKAYEFLLCDFDRMVDRTLVEAIEDLSRVFHYESDFQHALAWHLHQQYPDNAPVQRGTQPDRTSSVVNQNDE